MPRDLPEATDSPELVLLCLARNCEPTLPRFFAWLAALQASGLRCTALIGENGSRDQTRALIEGSTVPGVVLVDTSAMATEPSRLVRMARGRHILLDALRARGHAPSFVCVADLDNTMEAPPAVAVMRASMAQLATDRSLFAIGASSTPVFYDLIALRAAGHQYVGLDEEIQAAKRHPLSYYRFHQKRIYANQRQVTRMLPMRCTSSFNGLCLYDGDAYKLGDYITGADAFTCEHVTFNESLVRATGREMLISSELCLQAPADHIPVSFARFWLDRVRKARHT